MFANLRTHGPMNPWTHGPMDLRTHGPTDLCTDLRTYGPMNLRIHGPTDPHIKRPNSVFLKKNALKNLNLLLAL